ncbi:MAG: sulfatase [Conexivisphaerales archaeon]
MKQPNIVIILMDTMRIDALGVYNSALSTPAADMLAKDSVVYENVITPSSWTLPAHISLFTGKYPSEHGIHESYDVKTGNIVEGMHQGNFALPVTIAEQLRKIGYNTVGISANNQISSYTRMDLGFNTFIDITKKDEVAEQATQYGRSRGEIAMNLARQGKFGEMIKLYRQRGKHVKLSENYPLDKGGNWITWLLGRASIESPFFLFINMMEMHDPYPSDVKYVPNQFHMNDLFKVKEIDPGLMARIRGEYFKQSTIADEYLSRIIRFLKSVYDETLIILTSDHGQALKERNYYGHGIYLYDELIRVPMVIKYPTSAKPAKEGLYSLVWAIEMLKGATEGIYEWKGQEFVISETYGIQDSLEGIKISESVRREYDVPRKAIIKGNYKLVVNGANGNVEEFTVKGKPVDLNDEMEKYEDLVNELSLIKGNEKFLMPEI